MLFALFEEGFFFVLFLRVFKVNVLVFGLGYAPNDEETQMKSSIPINPVIVYLFFCKDTSTCALCKNLGLPFFCHSFGSKCPDRAQLWTGQSADFHYVVE